MKKKWRWGGAFSIKSRSQLVNIVALIGIHCVIREEVSYFVPMNSSGSRKVLDRLRVQPLVSILHGVIPVESDENSIFHLT